MQTMFHGWPAHKTRLQMGGFISLSAAGWCRSYHRGSCHEVTGQEQHLGISPWESSARWSFWIWDNPETDPCLMETCSGQLPSTLLGVCLCPTRF